MNQLYNPARERLLLAQINWVTIDWVAWLLTDAYVFDAAHNNFFTDVPAPARVARSLGFIGAKTATDGWASGGPITFGRVLPLPPAVPPLGTTPLPPRPCSAVAFVNNTDSRLLWFGDTGFNFPFMADGSEVVLFPDISYGGFFRV